MRKIVMAATTATVLAAAVLLPRTATAAPTDSLGECAVGELCLWEKGDFQGARQTHELAGSGSGAGTDIDIDSCVPLPPGTSAQALANRTGRPVTTYQSNECAETGEFETYPGSGTWVPQSPYRIRAFKVWEN